MMLGTVVPRACRVLPRILPSARIFVLSGSRSHPPARQPYITFYRSFASEPKQPEEQPKTEQPKTDETKTEQEKTEQEKTEQEKTDQEKTDQEKTEQQTEQTEQKEQPSEQQKEKKSTGSTVIAYGILALIGFGIYYSGLIKPINDLIDSNVMPFWENLKQWAYGSVGVTEHEVPFLPPALPDAYMPRYTIVIDMDSLTDYVPVKGTTTWRLQKRAGLDYFLANLARNYEVVLFVNQPSMTNQAAVFKLDPAGNYFMHLKYKESGIKLPDGRFTPDLARFLRDPSRIIFLDSQDTPYNHDNVLCIGRPRPGKSDTVLIDLVGPLNTFAEKWGGDARNLVRMFRDGVPQKSDKPLISNQITTESQQQQQTQQEPSPQVEGQSQGWKSWFGGK